MKSGEISTQEVEPPVLSFNSEASYVKMSSLRGGATVWGMVGKSEVIRKLQDRIRSAASSDLSVLILGETGSGKELVANAIHNESNRSKRRFVALNTGAVPRELVASELFGHVKGSFTGAINDRKGCFVEADGGTLFLDELTTMDERTQVGLLRALEQRVIQPVGASKDVPVNVRIVAATNNLQAAVKSGAFREDLYYRLESFVISVPPLRARPEDIPVLAAHFADSIAIQNGRTILGFTANALRILSAYNWPGNIRELKNAISQAVILTPNGIIDSEHLPEKLESSEARAETAAPAPTVTPSPPPAAARNASQFPFMVSLGDGLDLMVTKIFEEAINVCGGNVTRAAQLLGISRKTIYNNLGSGNGKLIGYEERKKKAAATPLATPVPALTPAPLVPAIAPTSL